MSEWLQPRIHRCEVPIHLEQHVMMRRGLEWRHIGILIEAVEEVADGNTKDLRDLPEAKIRNSIYQFLVFVHLLKDNADRICKLLLGHAQHITALFDAPDDVYFDRGRLQS